MSPAATNGTARFAWEPLVDFATAAFEKAGMASDDARLTASTLVTADLRGVGTHGMVRLPIYVRNLKNGTVSATAQPEIVKEGAGTALMDGQNGMGQVVSSRGMQLAIDKAKQNGVAVVTVRNSNHFGTCAHWALMAAEQGMIGIATTNSSPSIAPTGGVKMTVGNNPMAIVAPSDGPFPLALDMAMTMVARGRIRLTQLRGEQIPLGWAQDKDGNPTTDPAEGLTGSLLPMGGYKGYGLAVMLDLLTAVLSGAALSPEVENMGFTVTQEGGSSKKTPPGGVGLGHMFLAINIEQFLPLADFKARVSAYAEMLHESPRAPGVNKIYVPGEIEFGVEQKNRAEGILFEDMVVKDLRTLAEAEGIALPDALG